MKGLWHLLVLIVLGISCLLTGTILTAASGEALKTEINNANKTRISDYIGFSSSDDPSSIASQTISKISDPFFLEGYSIGSIFQAKFYVTKNPLSKTQPFGDVVTSIPLSINKAGLLMLLVIGPTLFGVASVDALAYTLFLKQRIFKYEKAHEGVNKVHNKKELKIPHRPVAPHHQELKAERARLKDMLAIISQHGISQAALYSGSYHHVISQGETTHHNRFQANAKDVIFYAYKKMEIGGIFNFRNQSYQYVKLEEYTVGETSFVQVLAKDIHDNSLITIIIGDITVKGDIDVVK